MSNVIENETQIELEKNISIRINMATSTDEIKPQNEIEKFAKHLKVGQDFKGNDAKALFQILKTMDKALMDENKRELKLIYEKVGFEFTDEEGNKRQINAKLGEGWFQNDLNHLFKLGDKHYLGNGDASKISNEFFIKATELDKIKNTNKSKETTMQFKNPVTIESIDKVIDGGIKSVSVIAESLGDESLIQFSRTFISISQSMGVGKITKNLTKENNITPKITAKSLLSGIGSDIKKAVNEGRIKSTKAKERSNMPTSRSQSK